MITTMQLRHTSLTGFKRNTPSPGSCAYTACLKVLSQMPSLRTIQTRTESCP